MGKVIAKKIRGMNRWAKVSLVTALTLLVSVFMYQGWYNPDKTGATPTISDAWTNVYAATASTASVNVNSSSFAVTAGSNRLLLVAVQFEIGTANTTLSSTTVTYGGVTVTPIQTTGATSNRSHAWMGYVLDGDIPTGSNAVNVQATAAANTITGVQIAVASYTDVDQTTPINSSSNSAAASATITFGSTVNYVQDGLTLYCANNGGAAATMTPPTGFTTAAGATSTVGGFSGFVAATAAHGSAGSYAGTTSFTFGGTTSTRSAIVVASLRPASSIVNPTVTSTSPNNMTRGTGPTTVTITGTGFQSGATVTFSGTGITTGTVTVANATTITVPVTVAAGATTGARDVTVTNTDTGTGTGTGVFTVNAAIVNPTVTSTSPNNMTQGTGPTTVTITGTGFQSGATVTFSGTGITTGTVTVANATTITVPVTVAAGATTGARNVTVTNTDTGTGTGTGVFTVNAAASCTRSAPTVSFGTPATILPGGNKAYTLTITNNDTAACSNSTFTLARGSETGNTASFVLPSVLGSTTTGALAPQGTYNTTFTVTAQAGATLGHTLTSTVTSSDSTNHAAQQGSGNVTTTIGSAANSPLMHNSANTSTTYGTWGTTFTCTTCHSDFPATTTNVKKVAQQLATPTGQRRVVFTRMTATSNSTQGVFGNDQRTYALNASTNVCEVCHHKTKYHQYSSSKVSDTSHYANDKSDCTKACHPHSVGFKSSGHAVPFYATTDGHTGCASGIGCHANTNPAAPYPTAGAPDCRACHTKADPTVSSNGCGSCHGAANGNGQPSGTVHPDAAGSHAAHTASPVFTACVTCHDAGGSGGNADHGKGNRGANPAIVNLATNLSWNGTNSTCGNTYCHSDGTGGTTNPGETRSKTTNTSPVWGTGNATCSTCHGKPPAYANYTGSTAVTGSKANAHQGATHSTKTCDFCHYSVTTSDGGATYSAYSSHNNGKYSIKTSLGYTYNAKRGGTCATPGCHGSIPWGGKLGCINCHNAAINSPVAQSLNAAVTQRRNIVGEFNNTWSHKRAASGAVTDEDCCVCHMEGNATTHKPDAAFHGNGYINLRDPDTGLNIKGVTFSGTPGSYTSTAVDAAPVRFSRNLGSSTIESDAAAIQINQCLKCHDTDGALSTSARVSTGSALKPFATTVASTSTYYLNNIAAANTAGSVVDVKSSFNSTNASYHPVTAKNNNGFIGNARLKAPWTSLSPDKTAGGTTTYGFLITCWDCHADTGATGTLTATVTAHGGAATVRGAWTPTVQATLCVVCHIDTYATSTSNHGTGSSFGSGGSSSRYTINRCGTCHGSTNAGRPWQGVDAHGFNQWAQLRTETVTPANSLKSGPTTSTGHRPYDFIRTNNMAHVNPNTVPAGDGTWTPVGNKPGCVRGSAACGNSHGTWTPGGSF